MTLKEAIGQLKSLKVYAEGEIPVYDTMREDDDNVWVGDVQALEVAIEALTGINQQDTKCNFCRAQTLENPGSHDFRVMGNSLYFHDSQFGWEGMEIQYCPKCGRGLPERMWIE